MNIRKAHVLIATGVVMLLGSCLKVGTNVGSNEITMNASVLKGRLSFARVEVFDAEGNWLWDGLSDENGQVAIELRAANQGGINIVVLPSHDSSMLCDASECTSPVTGEIVAFNEPVSLARTTDLELSSSVHTDALNSNQPLQISGLTQLTNRWLKLSAPENYLASPESHRLHSQISSKLITASLGLDIPADLNLMDLSLVDINQNAEFQNRSANTSLLSLVNASLSSDIQVVGAFSDALEALAEDPNNLALQSQFESLQKTILRETQKLATLPGISGIDVSVIEQIDDAATKPLDFTGITKVLNEDPTEPDDDIIKLQSIQGSSAHWLPQAGNLRPNYWWWVSRSDSVTNEWIQFDFAEPVLPEVLLIGLDKDRAGHNLILQARNPEDIGWTDLETALSEFVKNKGETDLKNVLEAVYPVAQEKSFSSYRIISSPTNSLWLEYLCFFQEYPVDDEDCFSNRRMAPIQVEVSSLWFAPDNVFVESDSWISSMASGKAEWLQMEYSKPFAPESVDIKAKVEFLGEQPEIQGLTGEGEWQTIVALDRDDLLAQADEKGFVAVNLPLTLSQPYQVFRYYSQPTTFIWLQSLKFNQTGE